MYLDIQTIEAIADFHLTHGNLDQILQNALGSCMDSGDDQAHIVVVVPKQADPPYIEAVIASPYRDAEVALAEYRNINGYLKAEGEAERRCYPIYFSRSVMAERKEGHPHQPWIVVADGNHLTVQHLF